MQLGLLLGYQANYGTCLGSPYKCFLSDTPPDTIWTDHNIWTVEIVDNKRKKKTNKKQAAVEFLTLIFYHLSFTGSQVALYTGQCCASKDLNQPANQPDKQTKTCGNCVKWNIFVTDRNTFITVLILQSACSRSPWPLEVCAPRCLLLLAADREKWREDKNISCQ